MKRNIDSVIAIVILIFLSLAIIVSIFIEFEKLNFQTFTETIRRTTGRSSVTEKVEGINKFSSQDDFKAWLQEANLNENLAYSAGFPARMDVLDESVGEMPLALPGSVKSSEESGITRVSETNVQVEGIDEPDIVKTDGKEIYFSSARNYYPILERIPVPSLGKINLVKAFPPEDLNLDSEINERGELLLADKSLVIFSGKNVFGYDVSDPESPKKEWEVGLEPRTSLTGARLYKGKIYLITQTNIDIYQPCPIRPLIMEGVSFEVKCSDVYYPVNPFPVDVTYNAFILDPATGEIEKNLSFVGSSDKSLVYMSNEGIYLTYYYYGDFISFMSRFFKEECQDIIPSRIIERIDKLSEYDISSAAKMTEFGIIFNNYLNSLDGDKKLRVENEINNRMVDYHKENKRELEKTGIVKIDLDSFDLVAAGNVPGKLLNQFSLDEYENSLRVAVTVGDGWSMIGRLGDSANDVYILDKSLNITGSVKDLGLTERIYSVRFVQDKGYVVTFREIDPFYVLDLSNPRNPKMEGELKIPGYSSYLHPITKDKILGIGKEGGQVKLSLFDVSSPKDPREIDKYFLNEYWSDVLNNHHAFLLDREHEVFFLPGNKGGYIFSYDKGFLRLERAVSDIMATRAIYINDYLYVIGTDKIIVLDEYNWEEINSLEILF
jgi:inhibitor of cysteine peptidase